MARSDLLISLVRASGAGNKHEIRKIVEAIIAEEQAKKHNILADRLKRALQTNGNGNGLNRALASVEAGPKANDYLAEVIPRKQFSDLVLSSVCQQACNELIEEQQRVSILRSHSLEPRHRMLLVGPPGNGKTSLAEAIADALAIPFFVVRYESLIGSFLGETATRLKKVFDYVRTTPCILFFDEFDTVGKERGDVHETGEIKRVVSSLLMQVDELPSYTVVIAATNHAELLDRAVWRRFQLRIELLKPNQAALIKYFENFSNRFDGILGYSPATLVKRLGALSYAEAEQFCLDVHCRAVLDKDVKSTKTIVTGQLEIWKERLKAAKY